MAAGGESCVRLLRRGVVVALPSGMNQTAVVNQINEFTAQTGVVAAVVGNFTRQRSVNYGTSWTISVVSNRAANTNNSGFGTTIQTSIGVDVTGTLGGVIGSGSGDVLTANGAQVRISTSTNGDGVSSRPLTRLQPAAHALTTLATTRQVVAVPVPGETFRT